MIASRTAINADFMTNAHRVSSRISVGPTGLIGMLNDVTTSLIDIEDAYYSRLQQPAKINGHLETAHVNKAHLALVVLARRADLGPQGLARGGFSRLLPVPVLLTTALFEVQGSVEVVNKFDPAELLMGGTGRFLLIYNATAVTTSYPDSTFSGGAILVNRTLVEMVAPAARGKS